MKLVKNVLLILIGLVIIGIGASTLRVAGLGVDCQGQYKIVGF
ncbi:hypothetical protein [Enterococcus faecalis]|nr:hypothetical protein [Enterococcus faecalis]